MNIFVQFIKSIYSPRHIAAFRFQGIGKTILYVFFLMLISSLPFVVHTSQLAAKGSDLLESSVINDFPDFLIKNGVLSSPHHMTETYQWNGTKIIFDPSGSIEIADLSKESYTIGILKNEIVIASNGEIQTIPYSMFDGVEITKDSAQQFLTSFQSSMVIILLLLFLFYYVFIAGMGFIKISIFAGIALLFRGTRQPPYRQTWRMSAYALTPSIVLFSLLSLLGIVIPFSLFIDWGIILAFLYIAIQSIPLPESE
ncbi:MAG TPA: DUF1189 domain-containing protein [Chondromyces sp.]|nr:DUF1189 domain-containing protein [Chondromyces sp.]